MGPIRAAVLVAVNLLMAGHIALWVVSGMRSTISPVEPSESMYTLERGIVNAGFVFFAVAIASTAVLGRWFCGWGCHIVALQDFCAWIMKKAGVKPKPFRSRLLVAVPVLLALYMFVWPTFKREVIKPLAGDRWQALAPYIGEAGARPQLQMGLTKQKFWETFPPWYVAVPFLAVCGFAAVYFLGAKGYCTYGCPYGGFFGPMDRVAPGRILVTDACEHCGHCTSVCSSNVRVHEEVRDFGMVVDPGCMKCLDCVSVCPNDALYFGFAAPPVLRKAPARRRLFDVSLGAEVVLLAIGFVFFWCYRGMLEGVPMLMATGIAGIGTFLCWKCWQMAREPSVRIQSLQLKLKGRVRPAGLAFGALTVPLLAVGAWGGMVQYSLFAANILASRMTVPLPSVLTAGYVAPPDQKELAERTASLLVRASPPSFGGWGWNRRPSDTSQVAYLELVLGRFADAETWLRRSLETEAEINGRPGPDVTHLARVMELRGAPLSEQVATYRAMVTRWPTSAEARIVLAHLLAASGDSAGAIEQATAAMQADPSNVQIAYSTGQLAGSLGQPAAALRAFEAAHRLEPKSGAALAGIASAQLQLGEVAKAIEALREAMRLEPDNPMHMQFLASILRETGQTAEASELDRRANDLLVRRSTPGAARSGPP
jgi:polyferredoxin